MGKNNKLLIACYSNSLRLQDKCPQFKSNCKSFKTVLESKKGNIFVPVSISLTWPELKAQVEQFNKYIQERTQNHGAVHDLHGSDVVKRLNPYGLILCTVHRDNEYFGTNKIFLILTNLLFVYGEIHLSSTWTKQFILFYVFSLFYFMFVIVTVKSNLLQQTL